MKSHKLLLAGGATAATPAAAFIPPARLVDSASGDPLLTTPWTGRPHAALDKRNGR